MGRRGDPPHPSNVCKVFYSETLGLDAGARGHLKVAIRALPGRPFVKSGDSYEGHRQKQISPLRCGMTKKKQIPPLRCGK
jgi:hypothetical protein